MALPFHLLNVKFIGDMELTFVGCPLLTFRRLRLIAYESSDYKPGIDNHNKENNHQQEHKKIYPGETFSGIKPQQRIIFLNMRVLSFS